MATVEKLEMDAHRAQLIADTLGLVEKYRAIFAWDVPEVDQALADRLIVEALRQALDSIEPSTAAA